ERVFYKAGGTARPYLFGLKREGLGDIRFYVRGYERNGNSLFRYALGGGDIVAPKGANVFERWRGIDHPLDQNATRVGGTLTLGPFGPVTLTSDLAYEAFSSDAPILTIADLVALGAGGLKASTKTINFIADTSKLISQSRLQAVFGWFQVTGGYGFVTVDQDNFSQRLRDNSYNQGRVDTHTAYLSLDGNPLPNVSVNVFSRYEQRSNLQSFPVPGFLDFTTEAKLIDPHVSELRRLRVGADVLVRTPFYRTNVRGGWVYYHGDRDFDFGVSAETIDRQRTLYTQDSRSHTFFVEASARPLRGLRVRVKPSFTFADETALLSEPTERQAVRASFNYYLPLLMGTTLSGFYQLEHKENDDKSYIQGLLTSTTRVKQEFESMAHSAGIALTLVPSPDTTVVLNYTYNNLDHDHDFIRSDLRRFTPSATTGVLFRQEEASNYNVSVQSATAAVSHQFLPGLSAALAYTQAWVIGDTASGGLAASLGRLGNRLDNVNHTVTLDGSFSITKALSVQGQYIFDDYNDDVDGSLSATTHSWLMAFSYRFSMQGRK
ncbi:MAG: hypothetical protein ACE5JS_10050, partial [Nitrospinota bacterium]